MRPVHDIRDLDGAFERAVSKPEGFGSGDLYVEER